MWRLMTEPLWEIEKKKILFRNIRWRTITVVIKTIFSPFIFLLRLTEQSKQYHYFDNARDIKCQQFFSFIRDKTRSSKFYPNVLRSLTPAASVSLSEFLCLMNSISSLSYKSEYKLKNSDLFFKKTWNRLLSRTYCRLDIPIVKIDVWFDSTDVYPMHGALNSWKNYTYT